MPDLHTPPTKWQARWHRLRYAYLDVSINAGRLPLLAGLGVFLVAVVLHVIGVDLQAVIAAFIIVFARKLADKRLTPQRIVQPAVVPPSRGDTVAKSLGDYSWRAYGDEAEPEL